MAALETRHVVVQGELPHEKNRRGGPGWWMDLDGVWRSPAEWPEDYPPIDGWVQDAHGQWRAPDEPAQSSAPVPVTALRSSGSPTESPSPHAEILSRQARADRRAMYTVAGVVGSAGLLLAAALILITQAGATSNGDPVSDTPDVVFAAETDQDRLDRQMALAAEAPEVARQNLVALGETPAATDAAEFIEAEWTADDEGCLDIAETVLIERSRSPIVWADQLECVPDRGQWFDRYLDETLTRTIDADVVPLVPPEVVFVSGAAAWSASTRQAYLTDQNHPATLQIVSAGAGHNPRGQDPSMWKPSSDELWCAFAVDWIAVKTHWQLTVTTDERVALAEMLDTCDLPTSAGADPDTVVLDQLIAPSFDQPIIE